MQSDLVSQLHRALTEAPPAIISTGFRELDLATRGGLRTRDVSVVLGFTGWGKSAFVEQLALQTSLHTPTLLLPLEMGEAKTMRRIGAKLYRCNETDFAQVSANGIPAKVAGELSLRRLRIRAPQPKRQVGIAEIERVIKGEKCDGAVRPLVIVDHVRELSGWLTDSKSAHVGPTQICQDFQDLAERLGVHVVLCSQIATDAIGKKDVFWRPQDTVMLQQIAALLIKIHRPFSDTSQDDTTCLIVAKNRYGPMNVRIPYRWVGESQLLFELDDDDRRAFQDRISGVKRPAS